MQNNILELNYKIELSLTPYPPFSFTGTFHKPSHFPTPDNSYDSGIYWQTMRFQNNLYGLKFTNSGTTDIPQISLSIYSDSSANQEVDITSIVTEIEYRFDLQSNLQGFTTLSSNDPALKSAVDRWRGMRISTPYSLYEFLVVTTVLQNTVVRRSVQMLNNLFQTYGTLVRFDGKTLYTFWSPNIIHQATEDALRELKVGYRAKIFKRQAENFVNRSNDPKYMRDLNYESLKKELLSIYGIGPATVQYILFEAFHWYDACEHISPWEQKIYSRLLFDQDIVEVPIILSEMEKRWGKWKMLAMHYIFEDLFWLRKNENIPWLQELIRL